MKITPTIAVSQRSQIQHSREVVRKVVEARLASHVINDFRSGGRAHFGAPYPAYRIRRFSV